MHYTLTALTELDELGAPVEETEDEAPEFWHPELGWVLAYIPTSGPGWTRA